MKKLLRSGRSAFTLTELLVVMGIIVLMGALVVPAVGGALKGSAINQASQTIVSQFNGAQQLALAKGQTVELRMILCGDPDSPRADQDKEFNDNWHVRGMQVYTVAPNQDPNTASNQKVTYTPISKAEFFPNSVIIDKATTLSSLCDVSNTKVYVAPGSANSSDSNGTTDYLHPKLPRIGTNYAYFMLQFKPDGSTSLDPNSQWFVTLHDINRGDKLATPPPNFFTVSIDPVQGSTRTFRPQ